MLNPLRSCRGGLAYDPLSSPGGVQTPSVAMAQPLLDRLRRAGLTFAVADA